MASDRTPTLRARVARVAAFATIAGAIAAAVTAGVLGERLVQAQEDARLLDAARTLAVELAHATGRDAALADEEMREIAHTGMRIALFVAHARMGGDALVPDAAVGCSSIETQRVCALAVDTNRTIVVSSAADPRAAFRRSFWSAAAIAIGIVALIGIFVSLRLASWAIAPLRRLELAVQRAGDEPNTVAQLAVPVDCREVDAVREALRDALQRIETTLARARRFSADAAHELRTPLTTALAAIELAAESSQLDLSQARTTLADVSHLLDRLLLLSAPPERADLREAVALAEIADDLVALHPTRVTTQHPTEGMVRGDATLLRVLVENLVDNALKFSASTVAIAIREDEHCVRVRVIDDGPGVAPSDRARVFDAFYRSAEARANSTQGSGIGLALVAHVAALHGGRVSLVDVQRGACFELELPRWAAGPRANTR